MMLSYLKVHQALSGKNNTISNESRTFANNTLARIISLVNEEVAIAA